MSRMENLDLEIALQDEQKRAQTSAEGGMTEDDLYMKGAKYAQMFCIGCLFVIPNLLMIRVAF